MADFCTSIGIVEQGELLASGRVEDILQQLQLRMRLVIEVADGQSPRLAALLRTTNWSRPSSSITDK